MTSWATIGAPSSAWAVANYDFKDRWVDWETTTWGAIQTSGFTWEQMAGFTFVTTTNGATTSWVNI